MKYQTIGGVWSNTSKTGQQYLSIKFDDGALDAISKQDLKAKLCLFPAKKNSDKSPEYQISAPMPDTYLPVYKKENK